MYNEKIEELINAALADGNLTEKEKQVLFKKAQAEGIDLDEFEVILDGRLAEREKAEKEKAEKAAPKSNKHGTDKQQKLNIKELWASAKLDKKDKLDKKKLVQKIFKYILIVLAVGIVIALIVFGSMAIYRSVHMPSIPEKLTIAPNPMFVVDDVLHGEISGTFESKAMPKDGKLVITPYLKVEEGRYYGNSITYVGELRNDGDVVVPYSGSKNIAQAFAIENPTYGKGMNLYLHFDASYGKETAKMKDVCVAPVWSIESLEAEKEYRQATPALLANIFFILSIVLLGLIILFIWQGWFSSTFGFLTIPLFVIFCLLTYFPARKVTRIETEIDDLRKQYDNTVRVYNRQQGFSYDTLPFDKATEDDEIINLLKQKKGNWATTDQLKALVENNKIEAAKFMFHNNMGVASSTGKGHKYYSSPNTETKEAMAIMYDALIKHEEMEEAWQYCEHYENESNQYNADKKFNYMHDVVTAYCKKKKGKEAREFIKSQLVWFKIYVDRCDDSDLKKKYSSKEVQRKLNFIINN